MNHGVFNEVSNRILDRVPIPFDRDWGLGSAESDHSLLCQCPRSHSLDNTTSHFVEVYRAADVQDDCIEASDAQQLLDQPIHTSYVGLELAQFSVSLHAIEGRRDDGEGRAQSVGSIRRELPLNSKATFQSIERTIHGGDKRRDFAREILVWKPN